MALHPILEDTDACISLVARYYSGEAKFGLPRTGSHFDDWDGGGDRDEIRNVLTADDFLAVSFLYVNVPPKPQSGCSETASVTWRNFWRQFRMVRIWRICRRMSMSSTWGRKAQLNSFGTC